MVYMLGQNEKYWREIYSIAERLGLEVKIIPVFAKDVNRKGCIKYPVGPAEFLGLFRDAKFVCTDSFHGMIFAIIFHVDFIEFERFAHKDPSNQNFRVYNIAELLSLEDRISRGKVEDDILMSAIDFHEVDTKLDELREDSLGWLKNTLASIENRSH